MLRLREIALRLLPLLVVVWATVALLGGAVHLVRSADPPDAGAAAKAGLGLCAVSVAVIARKVVRQATAPPLLIQLRPVPSPRRPLVSKVIVASLQPPTTGPPNLLLLQVSRT